MRKKTSLKDIAVIGLALFAMFFGAGNLIFPPYLGTNAGSEWFIGFMCFFIADVGLALVAILSMFPFRALPKSLVLSPLSLSIH